MKITAAADGSALGNPGPAGWGWYIDDDHWASGGWPHGTNNMGELMAVLDLLKQTRGVEELEILCDSQYVINSVTKWMAGWKKKGWRKADGKPVLNVDLIKELDRELSGRTVTFTWVKGHAGHPLNEAADRKANAAAQSYARGRGGPAGPGFGGEERTESRPPAEKPAAREDTRSPGQSDRGRDRLDQTQLEAAAAAGKSSLTKDGGQGALLSWDDDVALWSSHEELSDQEQVLALERELLKPEIRRDPAETAYLLHPDVQEIGSSGRLWSRDDILSALASDDGGYVPEVELIAARDLGPSLIQLVYRLVESDGTSLRTSVWQHSHGRWQLLWHQGTPEAC